MEWPHLEWWQFLFTIFLQRKPFHQQPLNTAGVPSHTYDDIPFERFTIHDAISRTTTLQHIFHNRCADSAAKFTLKNLYGNLITNYHQNISNIFQWHLWLAQLAAALPTKPKKPTIREPEVPNENIIRIEPLCLPHEFTILHSIDAFSRIFPTW